MCWFLFLLGIDGERQITVKPRKHELIIRENQPLELPPDVVRGTICYPSSRINNILMLLHYSPNKT